MMKSMDNGNSDPTRVSGLGPNEGAQSNTLLPGLQLVDLGVKAQGGWSAAKALVENSMGGLGEVNYGEFYIDSFALPSVDIYYDDPVKSGFAERIHCCGKEFDYHKAWKLAYVETDEIPGESELKEIKKALGTEECGSILAVAGPSSLAAAIYGCSQTGPMLLEKFLKSGLAEEEILWAWTTVPLPPLVDDEGIMAYRLEAALEYGCIASFWVRSEDGKIEALFNEIPACGEIRIHNLSSAKTIIKGAVDKGKLKEAFGI